MSSAYLYLLLDLAAISIPLACSFYSGANFSKKWRYLLPALLLPAAIFIAWDVLYTHWGVWGFNATYLTGVTIINLPLEEWLFFICIPYACVFTYFAFTHLIKREPFGKIKQPLTWLLITVLLVTGLLNLGKIYTSVTFISLAAFLIMHVYFFKAHYLGRFYFTYLIILIPFFIINGILTGSGIEDQVVWYDNSENLGIRIGTIPIEDIFYGMLLILMNVTVFEELQVERLRRK
ncbi:Lycopene cyclase [Fulvivirga imtechensis AK7]|uniref:Lycopene cyclase n=1 Tax=Fulvivirga imtechensis AK7 TaxID=1237149 RepID=L8JT14_9BACT|nr:lycopene cyclase domain-containing protein [Fulvivirga imtechensis]ELR70634.1 Lycopene cyclase [Fulvivirga imtechensis AK7]